MFRGALLEENLGETFFGKPSLQNQGRAEQLAHAERRGPAHGSLHRLFQTSRERRLLNGATNLRKHVVRVRTDEPDRAHDNDQNHSQHHCVFRNVLSTLIVPELL
jgi:hypothetical protein